MAALSPNTQAILLLTAPLIVGRAASSNELLSPREYKDLARRLRDIERQPGDLLSPGAGEILHDCQEIIDHTRLARLLDRGFLLTEVSQRWQARAIWVASRADAGYPRALKARLREDAPAVLYGCGDKKLLEAGGLAVVGSRDAAGDALEYAENVGRLAARAGIAVVSGGARGIDRAAMLGALEGGGTTIGVLADSLEKTTMVRETRNAILDDQMVLVSPYDPSAGFNVGHAMRRNKLIYALADAALVVSADLNTGGTWAGAAEQLDKFGTTRVFVRAAGEKFAAFDALVQKGAAPWPAPFDADALRAVVCGGAAASPLAVAAEISLPPNAPRQGLAAEAESNGSAMLHSGVRSSHRPSQSRPDARQVADVTEQPGPPPEQAGLAASPADMVFNAVRLALQALLDSPMTNVEIARSLDVSVIQVKAWLKRLVTEEVIVKQSRPVKYRTNSRRLFN